MPTVLRQDGLVLRIYVNDHSPPHVHVLSKSGEAKIALTKYATLLVVYGKFTKAEARKAKRLVQEHLNELFIEWSRYHEDP